MVGRRAVADARRSVAGHDAPRPPDLLTHNAHADDPQKSPRLYLTSVRRYGPPYIGSMAPPAPLEMTLLPGARALLAIHARELPQRDDLCGAFCGALALGAAGLAEHAGEPVDQDAVALAAGSVVSAVADVGHLPARRAGPARLPAGAAVRRGRRASPARRRPGGATRSRSSPRARSRRSRTRGPWTAQTLGGLFEAVAALEHPVDAGRQPRHAPPLGRAPARGSAARPTCFDGELAGPPPDWDVGHFVCVVGRMRGPGGSLYGVADTYPSLGHGGVHLQPRERLAAALARRDRSRDMPAGGDDRRRRLGARTSLLALCARVRGARRARRGSLGQRHRHAGAAAVSATELVALVCCDLGAIVRGRSLLASRARASSLRGRRRLGAGQPLAHAARPARRAQPVRLDRRPAPAAGPRHPRARRGATHGGSAARLRALRHRRDRRRAVGVLSAALPARGAERARARARRARCWRASSTSSSCCSDAPARGAVLAGGAAARRAVRRRGDGRAGRGRRAARALLRRVRARTSSRSPWRPPRDSRARTAASCSRRSCARSPRRRGLRASFAPLLDPARSRATACTSTSPCSTPPEARCSMTPPARHA